jgi:SAM-dependent methyltransferase
MSPRPKRNIAYYVDRRLRELRPAGLVAVDVPAGAGITSALLAQLGADVRPLDLFPGGFQVADLECRRADLGAELPLEQGGADLLICQEGIEHLPDHLHALREFNRARKPGGRLLITTPSVSHLRARLSHLLNASDLYSRLPPTEADSIWLSDASSTQIYFGHVFLIGAQQLRVLGRIAAFRIDRVNFTRPSWGSVLLGFLLPFIAVSNLYGYWHSVRRGKQRSEAWKRSVYRQALRLNLDPKLLFGKYLFVELVKECELDETAAHFHELARGRAPDPSVQPADTPPARRSPERKAEVLSAGQAVRRS